ncbi:hypothetical protein HK101_004386, partial [Irineochytrium annulatum]
PTRRRPDPRGLVALYRLATDYGLEALRAHAARDLVGALCEESAADMMDAARACGVEMVVKMVDRFWGKRKGLVDGNGRGGGGGNGGGGGGNGGGGGAERGADENVAGGMGNVRAMARPARGSMTGMSGSLNTAAAVANGGGSGRQQATSPTPTPLPSPSYGPFGMTMGYDGAGFGSGAGVAGFAALGANLGTSSGSVRPVLSGEGGTVRQVVKRVKVDAGPPEQQQPMTMG